MSLKVHLDPGHFSATYNNSTTNRAYYESAAMWKLTQYLKQALESKGIEVSVSRTNINSNPGLYDRGFGAKGCDVFLSLHSNASGTEKTDYPVVIRGYDKKEADNLGLQLAKIIQSTIGTRQNGRTMTKRGNNGEYYGVLRGARAAGLTYYYIVEHSFHTNTYATNWLLNDNNLKLLAEKEAEVIANYFGVKNNNNTDKKEDAAAPVVETPVQIGDNLYRVRKSWADAASQIGAFKNLKGAKKACKVGYTVYDCNGNAVYSNTKTADTQVRKTNEQIAKEVIQGKWGNGNVRKTKLAEAGYNYSSIQKLVSKLLGLFK